MPQLVDPSFLQAYGNILGQRNQAIRGFGQSLLGGAAQVGTAAIGRGKDRDTLQADIEAQRKALEGEAAALSEQAFQIAPTAEAGPYEQAEAKARLADIGIRQKDIQNQLESLGAIGDVTWRNVYDVRLPQMPKREATGYAGRWRDIASEQKPEPVDDLGNKLKIIEAEKQAKIEIEKAKPTPAPKEKTAPAPKPVPQTYATTIQAADETLSGLQQFEQMISDPEKVSRFTPQVKARADAMRGGTLERAAGAINPLTGSSADVEKVADMFALAESIYAPIRNKTFGAALSKGDLERAAQNQPTPGDTPEILKKKVYTLRQITQKARDWWYNFAQKQGYNTGGLEPQVQPQQPKPSGPVVLQPGEQVVR